MRKKLARNTVYIDGQIVLHFVQTNPVELHENPPSILVGPSKDRVNKWLILWSRAYHRLSGSFATAFGADLEVRATAG